MNRHPLEHLVLRDGAAQGDFQTGVGFAPIDLKPGDEVTNCTICRIVVAVHRGGAEVYRALHRPTFFARLVPTYRFPSAFLFSGIEFTKGVEVELSLDQFEAARAAGIVEVRCAYCREWTLPKWERCPHCGAQMKPNVLTNYWSDQLA